jgi:hypothetical protein
VAASSGRVLYGRRHDTGALGPWWASSMLLAVLAVRGGTPSWTGTIRGKMSVLSVLYQAGTTEMVSCPKVFDSVPGPCGQRGALS